MVTASDRSVVNFSLFGGEKHDAPEGVALLEKTNRSEETVYLIMDRAYEGDAVRETAIRLGYIPVVLPKKNRKESWEYDKELYKQRNEIERFFLCLKRFRRVFSRYDKLDIVFTGFIFLTLIFDAIYCEHTKYYISCGDVWNDLECTTEIAISLNSIRLDEITVNEKTYVAEYYGDQYIGYWSKDYLQRTFWRLQNAYEDFKDKPFTGDVLPYNNYNPMNIEIGQVFVIDYLCKDSETVQRRYYISNGRVWNNMECTSEVAIL